MAAVAALCVVPIVIFGFVQSGPPGVQRGLRADSRRVRALYQLNVQITNYWQLHNKELPATIDQFSPNTEADPLTHAPYEYHPGQGSRYELCATFDRASDPHSQDPAARQWQHPAGHHCFARDATVTTPFLPLPSVD